jgi:hypothetical protein
MVMTRGGFESTPKIPAASAYHTQALATRSHEEHRTPAEMDEITPAEMDEITPGTADGRAGAAVDRHILIAEALKIKPAASAPTSDLATMALTVQITGQVATGKSMAAPRVRIARTTKPAKQ